MKDYGRLENIQEKINRMKQESKDPNFTSYLAQMQIVLDKQCMSADYLDKEIERNYQVYLQSQQSVSESPQVSEQQQAVPVQNISVQNTPVQNAPVHKKKNSMEFKIGASLFCVIGVLFILISFIMLGITYMNGMVKGLSLYLISILLIVVSELVLRRKMEKFAMGITGLGICGLYASTVVNSIFLENFGGIVAVILTVIISVLTVFIGYKKDSGIIKVLSFLGGFICVWPVGAYGTNVDFALVMLVLLAVNIVSLLLPVKKHVIGVYITQMIANVLFIVPFVLCANDNGIDGRLNVVCVLTNILVLGFVFVALKKIYDAKKAAGQYGDETGCVVLYSILLFVESALYVGCASFVYKDMYVAGEMARIWYHGCLALYLVPCLILFLMQRKSRLKWIQYYAAIITAWIAYVLCGNEVENVVFLLSIFIVAKLLSRIQVLKISEIVITLYAVIGYLVHINSEEWYAYALVGAFALSILALRYYKVLYQSLITFVIVTFAITKMWEISLWPAATVGILLLLLLIFNHVKIWKGKQQILYNLFNLAVMCFCYFMAIFTGDYMNSIIMTLLGTAVIIFAFSEKYSMEFKYKYLLLSMFWTYMAMVSGIETAVIISSLIMVVAIISVIVGFALERKEVRIYGLVVSILVSIKLMFFDFGETPIMERMLLFLIVGVIILSISCIYIVLEKKMSGRSDTE